MLRIRVPVFFSLIGIAVGVALLAVFPALHHSIKANAGPPPLAETLLGLNLPAVADWSTDAAYVDAKAYFRRWGNAQQPWNADPTVKLDANRYPLSTAGALCPLLGYPDGTYQVQFRGAANVALGGIASPMTLRSSGEPITNPVRIRHGQPGSLLTVTVTPRDPKQPLSDFRLISPGYPADTRQIFRNEYLNDVRSARVLRFMDPMAINNSPVRQWSDRTPPAAFYKTSFDDAQTAGVPYEEIISLCNATHAIPWICIPDQADDDFIRHLADLFRDGLDPDLPVIVEWSNEVWNGIFKQYHRAAAAAKGNDQLTAADEFGRTAQQVGFEAVRIKRLFDAEYGARKSAVRVVLCGQAANSYFCQTALEWMAAKVGPPADYLYAIGIGPYVGDSWTVKAVDQPGLTADSLFTALNDALHGPVKAWITAHKTLADQYGVRLYAYEAGQHLVGPANEPLKKSAQTDPRMGKLYRDLMEEWKQAGGSVMCLYHYCGPSGPWGYWGLKQSADDRSPPKWQAFVETAAQWNGPPREINLAR